MMDSVQITLHVSPDLLKAIDAKRGDVPRNIWLRRVVAKAVGKPSLATANPIGRPKKT